MVGSVAIESAVRVAWKGDGNSRDEFYICKIPLSNIQLVVMHVTNISSAKCHVADMVRSLRDIEMHTQVLMLTWLQVYLRSHGNDHRPMHPHPTTVPKKQHRNLEHEEIGARNAQFDLWQPRNQD